MPQRTSHLRTTYLSFICLALVVYPIGGGREIPDRHVEVRKTSRSLEIQTKSDGLTAARLVFAGDCTFGAYLENYIGDQYDYPFRRFDLFSQADVSMVNLENPITTYAVGIKKRFNFKMNPRSMKLLTIAGIDVVSLANNHIYDYGDRGLLDTIYFLDSLGIKHVGAGKNLQEARKPVVFEVKGFRIGFLGYFGAGVFSASHTKPGVAPRFERTVIEDIQNLKEKEKVDYAVINFHWGDEKAVYPADWQVNLARSAVRAGADLIVGHHPHVLQGIEKYKHGVIAYSLGNFLFGGNSRRTYDTAVLQVDVQRDKRQVSVIPVRVKVWQPIVLMGSEGQKVLTTIRELSRRFPESIF